MWGGGGGRPGAHLDPISLVSQPRCREGNSFPRPAVGQPRCPHPQRGGFPAGPSTLHVAQCSFELWSWGQWFTEAGLEPDWPGQKHWTLPNLQPNRWGACLRDESPGASEARLLWRSRRAQDRWSHPLGRLANFTGNLWPQWQAGPPLRPLHTPAGFSNPVLCGVAGPCGWS